MEDAAKATNDTARLEAARGASALQPACSPLLDAVKDALQRGAARGATQRLSPLEWAPLQRLPADDAACATAVAFRLAERWAATAAGAPRLVEESAPQQAPPGQPPAGVPSPAPAVAPGTARLIWVARCTARPEPPARDR